jgi:hypothetical protein
MRNKIKISDFDQFEVGLIAEDNIEGLGKYIVFDVDMYNVHVFWLDTKLKNNFPIKSGLGDYIIGKLPKQSLKFIQELYAKTN